MSHSSFEPLDSQERAQFAGNTSGGLARDDRIGILSAIENHSPEIPNTRVAAQADDEWGGGFDFHLGAHSRF